MNLIIIFFKTYSLPIQLMIISLIYLKQMDYQKRKRKVREIGIGLLSLFFVGNFILIIKMREVINVIMNENMLIITILYCVIAYLIVVLFLSAMAVLPVQDILFITNCSYLTQHFIHCVNLELCAVFQMSDSIWIEGSCFLIGYLLCYFKFAAALISRKGQKNKSLQEIGTTVGVIAVAITLSAVVKELTEGNRTLYISCMAYAMIFCFYALWVEADRKKKADLEEKLMLEQQCFVKYKEQYEMSQENINLINHKCHDLKHQIAALRHIEDEHARNKQIGELEKAVFIYDAIVHTGNEVLDTLLTEKSLYCEQNGIALACVADGKAVSGMDPVDIYTIFGNALDNALECVAKFEDKTRKTISVIVTKRANMLLFQFENYYDEIVSDDKNEFHTTKEQNGYHGFGLKSIEHTAEKYGGIMNISTDHSIFLLQVMIPQA